MRFAFGYRRAWLLLPICSVLCLANAKGQVVNPIPLGYSYILKDSTVSTNPQLAFAPGSPDPANYIFQSRSVTGVVTAVDTSLSGALIALFGANPPKVDALSYGCDQGHHPTADTVFLYSVQLGPGWERGAYRNVINEEIRTEVESDLYVVPNEIAPEESGTVGVPKKIADENGASNVPSVQFPNPPRLALTGTVGNPSDPVITMRSNIAGFARMPASIPQTGQSISFFFSIDTQRSAGGTTYYPGDILRFDPTTGNITVELSHLDLGLAATDNVDAISLDLYYSEIFQYPPHLWFSLEKNSLASSSTVSGADIFSLELTVFEFPFSLDPVGPVKVDRDAESNGLFRAIGEIDSIISIDPVCNQPEGRISSIDSAGRVIYTVTGGYAEQIDLQISGLSDRVIHSTGEPILVDPNLPP